MIESGQASTTECFSLLLLGLSESFQTQYCYSLLSKPEQCTMLCFFLFQRALIAFQQYAIVIKNSSLDLLEGTNLNWAMGTKGTNQKNVLPIMLFSSLELKGKNLCEPSVIAVCLNATFSLRL